MTEDKEIYKNFLNKIEKKISEAGFTSSLCNVIKIDLNHYTKKINKEKMLEILNEYKNKEINKSNKSKVFILTNGNPEIVFRVCLESVRNNVSIYIGIEDFCVAQCTLIVKLVDNTLKEMKLNINVELKNLITLNDKIEISKNVDETICIGDSNTYNILSDKTKNIRLYPYNIFDVYVDSNEFESIQKSMYDFAMTNEYEMEIYDKNTKLEDAIEFINEGHKFCAVLISRNLNTIKKFKENVKSQYIFVNESPFNKIKFDLDI